MKSLLRRYWFFLLTLAALGVFLILGADRGLRALSVTAYSIREMILVIPPVFLLLGLLDVWVPRDAMVRFMGPGAGLKGVVLAIVTGSAAAGPLYGAFPVAAVFLRKGASITNVLIFVGAWSTTKIPMFLFELSALGPRFALTRLAVDIPGIILIALLLSAVLGEKDRSLLLQKAERMGDADGRRSASR
jgi:uncharacterized membrane protein YraQ (UPF0718 family)